MPKREMMSLVSRSMDLASLTRRLISWFVGLMSIVMAGTADSTGPPDAEITIYESIVRRFSWLRVGAGAKSAKLAGREGRGAWGCWP